MTRTKSKMDYTEGSRNISLLQQFTNTNTAKRDERHTIERDRTRECTPKKKKTWRKSVARLLSLRLKDLIPHSWLRWICWPIIWMLSFKFLNPFLPLLKQIAFRKRARKLENNYLTGKR